MSIIGAKVKTKRKERIKGRVTKEKKSGNRRLGK